MQLGYCKEKREREEELCNYFGKKKTPGWENKTEGGVQPGCEHKSTSVTKRRKGRKRDTHTLFGGWILG